MRIVIFSKEAHLDGISHHVPSEKFMVTLSIEDIEPFRKVDELTYLFIDIDDANGSGHQLNKLMLGLTHVKRVVLSGHFSPKDFKKHQFSDEGADGYLKKPFDSSDFLDLIEDFSYFYRDDSSEIDSKLSGGNDLQASSDESTSGDAKENCRECNEGRKEDP